MAVIGKIRQHSGLLIGIIGASIVGFLVMDATQSQGSVLKGQNDTLGKVNGEKISINDFEKKYEENIKTQEMQMRGQPLTDDMRFALRNQTWDQMVNEVIFDELYNDLGLTVTPEEMNELATGENPHPYILQSFSNPQTGQFDPAQVSFFLTKLDEDDPGSEPGSRRRQWMAFEKEMRKSQYLLKYDNLISKGMYVPTWLGEVNYNDQNRTVDFKYVTLAYNSITDDQVKPTDDELKAHLEKNAALYKRDDETRKIQYVTFDIVASSADSAATLAAIEEKREEFAAGETVSDDSMFVRLYSETPFDQVYYTKDDLTSSVKDSLFGLPVKSLIGPYVENGQYILAKISDRKAISDSVRIRQIKIGFNDVTTQEAGTAKRKMVDSVFKAIDSLKADFGAMALQYSDDALTKMNGGMAGWVKQNEKEKEFNDLLFYRAQKGKTYLFGSAQENAFYIFQIVEDKPSKTGVLVTYLTQKLIPSPETDRNIFSTANAFATDNQTAEKFIASGKKQNIKTVGELRADQFSIGGLGNARELVKWAFKAEKGSVSTIFSVTDKYVVALLEEISPKGLPPLDVVREQVKVQVIKEKKFELLAKKLSEAGGGSVEQIAGKVGAVVMAADKASFTSPAVNGSYEPKVVATALGTAPNKLSAPVEGNSGAFVVQTVAVNEPAKQQDYSIYTYQLKQQAGGKARMAEQVHKKLAEITDNRATFASF